jgi:hypothetical protein
MGTKEVTIGAADSKGFMTSLFLRLRDTNLMRRPLTLCEVRNTAKHFGKR